MAFDNAISKADIGVNAAPIILDFMPQQKQIRTRNDDWTGQSNQAERRRRQNRLNQRAHRKRKEGPMEQFIPIPSFQNSTCFPNIEGSQAAQSNGREVLVNYDPQIGIWQPFSTAIASSEPQIAQLTRVAEYLKSEYTKPSYDESKHTLSQFQKWAARNNRASSPSADCILVLIKFNIFRALVNNSMILGFPVEWTVEDEALSPFAPMCKFENHLKSPQALSRLPATLRPTALQCRDPHHPWIDLLPVPRMRDNLILAEGKYDDFELCEDLCGFYNNPRSRTGLIVWGDPWDPAGWELRPLFIKKWTWVLIGCTELMHSTNYWRKKRGEMPLDFKGLLDDNIVEIS